MRAAAWRVRVRAFATPKDGDVTGQEEKGRQISRFAQRSGPRADTPRALGCLCRLWCAGVLEAVLEGQVCVLLWSVCCRESVADPHTCLLKRKGTGPTARKG